MRLQDLPRELACRALAIPRFCRDELGLDLRGSRLLVAYSTGSDSTALLHLLHALSPSLGLKLCAAHAHHGLRPESDAEEDLARKTCAELKVQCLSARLNVAAHLGQGPGLEECARTLRYAFLEHARQAAGADWIVTAHHAGDLAEDIFLRLIRGAGWPGLGGMPGIDAKRHVLRPVLNWEKNELVSVLKACGIEWSEDASNASHQAARNRVRGKLLPLVFAENPEFSRAALQMWKLARLDADFWEQALCGTRKKSEGEQQEIAEFLPRERLLALHAAARLRLYKKILDGLGTGQARAQNLFALDAAFLTRKTGAVFQFPGGKEARLERRGIVFTHKNS